MINGGAEARVIYARVMRAEEHVVDAQLEAGEYGYACWYHASLQSVLF